MSKSRDAIEAQRTALSAANIGSSVQAYDADTAKLDVEQTYTAAQTFGTVAVTGNVDGRDVSVDGTKLDGIEANATADQTGAQIKTAYQAETNAFTDAQFTKLAGVADSANNYSHPTNHAISVVTGLQSALDGKTTESYVNTAVSNLVDSSPAALNTLNELAAALGDDANFSTTTATALGLRVSKDSDTGAASMPTGTTAQRPTGALGMFRHNTTLNQFEGYNDGAWGALAGGGEVSFVTYEYIATAGQTTFSGADSNNLTLAYTVANIIVSYGGQDLPHSDYTATNGTSVVLDDGAVAGEIVRIVAFTTFAVANTYTQSQADTLLAAKATNTALATTNTAVALKAPIATPVFTGDATVSTGNLVIGTNGKGIDFSANADSSATGASTTSELLDDYEEGTWTPAFGRNGGTQPTVTYGEQVGSYTKVGNMVFLTGDMYISSISIPDNGNLTITGMPFTKGSGHNPTGSFTFTGFNFSKARSQIVHLDGTKLGFLGQTASTGAGSWNWEELAALDGGEALRFAITYQV